MNVANSTNLLNLTKLTNFANCKLDFILDELVEFWGISLALLKISWKVSVSLKFDETLEFRRFD